jgi:hypothetical protein
VGRFFQIFWAALAAVIICPVLGGYFYELLYAHPSPRAEAVVRFLVGAASHPVYLVCASTVLGMALGTWMDTRLRRRDLERRPLPKEWIHPYAAVTHFGDKSLLDKLRKLDGEVRSLSENIQNLSTQHDRFYYASLGETDQAKQDAYQDEAVAAALDQSSKQTELERLKEEKKACWQELSLFLDQELKAGHVIAKGFLSPHKAGAEEIIIPVGEWRFLNLKADEAKATGPSVEYMALLLGRVSE